MSLYKRPDSRIWWAAIRLPDGGRVCRSSGTANRQEAQEWLDHVRADLWRIHRLGERRTYTWQDAVVRWCNEKADKATAREDRASSSGLTVTSAVGCCIRSRATRFRRSARPKPGKVLERLPTATWVSCGPY